MNIPRIVHQIWIGNDLPWSDWSLSISKKILGASIKKKISLIEEILREKNINIVETNKIDKNKLNKIEIWAKNLMVI